MHDRQYSAQNIQFCGAGADNGGYKFLKLFFMTHSNIIEGEVLFSSAKDKSSHVHLPEHISLFTQFVLFVE